MESILAGLSLVTQSQNLLFLLLGLIGGFVVGVLPGFSGANAAALVLPFSIGLAPESALILMASIYAGASFAGAIPAILMNVPGTAGAAATALDGYPMARAGLADRAIGIARMSSTLGGVLGMIIVISVIGPLGKLALSFGAREMFIVAIFGLMIIAAVVGDDVRKGLISALIGLLVAAMSASPLTGEPRLTFGFLGLYEGVPFVPAIIGLFAFTQLFLLAGQKSLLSDSAQLAALTRQGSLRATAIEVMKGIRETLTHWRTVIRSGLIGVGLGVIPGVGTAVANFVSYGEAKRKSPRSRNFGKGEPEGIVASEATDNAVVGGTMVPTLTLGVPGSGTAAVMLGALYLHGIQPGPRVLETHAPEAYSVLISMLFASILILPIGILLATPLTAITKIKPQILVPIVLVLSSVGAFAVRSSLFDVGLAVVFGLVGLFLRLNGYPIVPLVLGLILGPIAETNFLRALSLGHGRFFYFFESVTANVLWGLLLVTILLRVRTFIRRRRLD